MSICATVKNKVREQHDVRLQLQANMVLAVVSILSKKILSNEVSMADNLSMTKLSCYQGCRQKSEKGGAMNLAREVLRQFFTTYLYL